MGEIRDAVVEVLAADHPMTVRGTFYRLVSAGVVAKTEGEYKSTVGRLVLELRRSGRVPYSWITDGTRLMRKPTSWADLDDALFNTARTYRRALWNDQPAYVEIWSEKDAISGVLYEVAAAWDVPLMVVRGFSSETFLHDAAAQIRDIGKPTFVYHFGDLDPSGVAAAKAIDRRLHEFAPDADITFNRAAVTAAQVRDWDLPTRPTKKTDSRSKGWVGESIEVDAIPPARLRDIAEECITRHVDPRAHAQVLAVEAEERALLERMAEEWTP